MNQKFDVIIVGARVAGATLAYLLAKEGFKVLLTDRATFPSDTLSTHNFFSNSLGMLRNLGVLDAILATNTNIYRRGLLNFDGAVIDGMFPESDGIKGSLCIRRKYLDHILLEHAKAQKGVTVLEGFRVTGLVREGNTVTGITGKRRENSDVSESYTANLVVGADGRLSTIRSLSGSVRKLSVPTDFASYVGYIEGFRQAGEAHTEFYKSRDKFVILFPTSDNQFVIGVMYPLEDQSWMNRFKADPEAGIRNLVAEGFAHTTLPDRLREAEFTETIRGLHGFDNDWHTGMGEGWALLGDALTFKDPTVGQGMHDALYGAHLLAEILAGYSPEEWKANWASMGEHYQSAMESKLMSRFWMGCQLTKNVPVPPEVTAAYHLVGQDSEATSTFWGIYNYVSEPEDLQSEIGRLLSVRQ